MSSENNIERITTIGGGTGTPIVNEALLTAGAEYITSVASTMDSGGTTGRRRLDSYGIEIAHADAKRILISLADKNNLTPKQYEALVTLLTKRDKRQKDLGHEIMSQLFDGHGNGYEDAQRMLENLTNVAFKGKVVPVTKEPTNIVFTTEEGITYKGEDQLDSHYMSEDKVKGMWLEPCAVACPDAVKAMVADFVVFSPGSLHGSVLCCLLPHGMNDGLKKSAALKIYVTNLVSARNETHHFTPHDFVELFRQYSGMDNPIDVLIVPQMTRREFESKYPDISRRYSKEHSHYLGWEDNVLKKAEEEDGVRMVTHKATSIVERGQQKVIRHDPKKLSEPFSTLLYEARSLVADLDSSKVEVGS
ncbi:MAG TPA: 2-phospho-L-lactate transferase CofD family protein [Patescibacteria group bacterium]